MKAEEEWAQQMTPDQKLVYLEGFVLSQYKERPENTARWVQRLVSQINAAGDTTKIRNPKRVNIDVTVDERQVKREQERGVYIDDPD